MAKKMRPRRPVKKATKVVGRKKRYKSKYKANKAAQEEAALRASLRKIDPFYLDDKLIPVGWSYQWVPFGTERREGWTEVPFSRHAHDFPYSYARDGAVVYGGQILIEGKTELLLASRAKDHQAARDMVQYMSDKYGFSASERMRGMVSGSGMLPPEEIVTKVLKDAPPDYGPPVDTPISLLIRIPQRWVAAAAYLNLTVSEYARRRVVGERLILGCMDGRIGELDAIYEPVNLHFSPNKEAQ